MRRELLILNDLWMRGGVFEVVMKKGKNMFIQFGDEWKRMLW